MLNKQMGKEPRTQAMKTALEQRTKEGGGGAGVGTAIVMDR